MRVVGVRQAGRLEDVGLTVEEDNELNGDEDDEQRGQSAECERPLERGEPAESRLWGDGPRRGKRDHREAAGDGSSEDAEGAM